MNAELFAMCNSSILHNTNDCLEKIILCMYINAFQCHALNIHDNIYEITIY